MLKGPLIIHRSRGHCCPSPQGLGVRKGWESVGAHIPLLVNGCIVCRAVFSEI